MSAAAASAGLAALQIWTGIQQAEMVRMQSRLTQQINEMNAQSMELDAYKSEIAGYSEIAQYEPMIDATVAGQRVAYAAADVDVTSGTAAEIQAETRLTGFLNKLEMAQQVRQKALGMRRQARGLRIQGSMAASEASMTASGAQTQGIVDAARTGVSAYARS